MSSYNKKYVCIKVCMSVLGILQEHGRGPANDRTIMFRSFHTAEECNIKNIVH